MALISADGQVLLKRVFKRMEEPPTIKQAKAAGARGWHMGGCLVLAEGLRIWLQDEEAVLYGCGKWTEPARREGHPGKFHHRGYWDYVDHVLLASGDYLIDGGGVYKKTTTQAC